MPNKIDAINREASKVLQCYSDIWTRTWKGIRSLVAEEKTSVDFGLFEELE